MRWFRALIVCCWLLALPSRSANAAPPSQSIDCDTASLISQYPWLREPLGYLSWPYARRAEATVEGQSLTFQICAPQNQSVTADRLLSVLVEALPRLSAASGVPLGGGVKRPIMMVGDEGLPSSVNGLLDDAGIIRVRNTSPERTIIHEGAHYWASEQNFAETWMIEGYADYLTEQVTGQQRIAIMPEATCAGVVLLRWGYDPPATALCGYIHGAAVFRDLAATLGPEPLRVALRDLHAQSAPISSWTLLVGLERASKRDLTSIFERHQVFPAEYDLPRRRQQWNALRQFGPQAVSLGVVLPPQIADDIDARAYIAADRWLSRLPGFLKAADGVAHSCVNLKPACKPLWQALPQDDPAAIEPIRDRLEAAQPLLDEYWALREAAQALDLAPPASLGQAVAALDLAVRDPLRQARATLERGRAFEQQCHALAAPCRPGWREQWSGGDFGLTADTIAKQTEVLNQSVQVEARCGQILDACRAVWHPYLPTGQFPEAHTALSKLNQLLERAASLKQRCGDVDTICYDSWQTALRTQQLPGLELRLSDIEKMLVHAQAVDQNCAGWKCDQIWRAVFRKSGDPRLALSFLAAAQQELPTLQRAAATTRRLGHADPSSIWPMSGPTAQTLIEQAHQAFEQGDVALARALADQSLAAAAARPPSWRTVAMPGGILLAVALLTGVFAITVRRKPLRARRRAADQALLNELLSRPAKVGKQQMATNIKKPHKNEAVAASEDGQAADGDEHKKAA